jgi:choline dehydrogenase-like flavoprotein
VIHANYFGSDKELDALVKGVRLGRQILAQPAMLAFHGGEESPGPQVQSDAELRQWIREHVETVYHTAGTCPMGSDAMAVVDADLRVHGVQRLRVIDSSVMPAITGSNIHAPTVMIAEVGAAKILSGQAER